MLKIYFTAATSFNGELHDNYKIIVDFLKSLEIELLSGNQIVEKKLLLQDKKLSKQEIYLREKNLIDKSDCVIAEVTKPSHGVGAEIDYALRQNKLVLALIFDPESVGTENKISPIIAGNPSENLFLEFYTLESLPFTIKDYLKHCSTLKDRRGKLIVIEGADGTGKTIQAKLLVNALRKKKIQVKYMDFPQYYPSFHGKTVAKFLRGEFGSINHVSPYLASLAYSLDRASVKEQMEDFLTKGGIIIANRYATSNVAHQGAKFKVEKEKEKFLKWVNQLEYKVHKIPKEDFVIYLNVPWQISLHLSDKKGKGTYLEGKEDIHEKDISYRKKVEKMYVRLAKENKNWIKIDCVEKNQLLLPETIHQKIMDKLQKILGLDD